MQNHRWDVRGERMSYMKGVRSSKHGWVRQSLWVLPKGFEGFFQANQGTNHEWVLRREVMSPSLLNADWMWARGKQRIHLEGHSTGPNKRRRGGGWLEPHRGLQRQVNRGAMHWDEEIREWEGFEKKTKNSVTDILSLKFSLKKQETMSAREWDIWAWNNCHIW